MSEDDDGSQELKFFSAISSDSDEDALHASSSREMVLVGVKSEEKEVVVVEGWEKKKSPHTNVA
jgi:hypothetical protein